MASFIIRMALASGVVTIMGVALVGALKWLEAEAPREVFGVVFFMSLLGFLFGGLPVAWWLTFNKLEKVFNGISRRMSRRDR